MYKAGFATTQKAYEDAVAPLFDSLDKLEKILAGKDYLVSNQLTEADVRLFISIVSSFHSLSPFIAGDDDSPSFALDTIRRRVPRRVQVQLAYDP